MNLFKKKDEKQEKTAVDPSSKTVEKKSKFAQLKQKASDSTAKIRAQVAETKSQVAEKALRAKRRAEIMFYVWNILSVIFYTVTTIITMVNKWSDSPLSYFVIGVTVVYVAIFVLIILRNIKDKDKANESIKDYKQGMNIWKIILNIVNTVIALLVVLNTLQADDISGSLLKLVLTALSIAWLAFKVVTSLVKLLQWYLKKRKSDKKAEKKQLKAEKKAAKNEK